jgi:cysteine-rich repeat protein
MNTISKIIVLLIFIFIGTAGVVYAGGPECGDGIVQEPEQCDDGNIISGDGCSALCQEEFCGDGIVQEPELCDDGNLLSGDGCNALCQIEFCGDGIVQEPELCDDGNLLNGDGCTTLCLIEFCGDGTVQVPEQCDDGNIISGDGCSAACTFDFGDQGCRPRYWKKSKHFGSWTAPFTPDTPFSSIFEDAFPGKSLRQVLKKDGEGLEGLGRQAVAALLNAASADVAYDRTVQQVIVMFNNVYPGTKHEYKALKNVFKALNELGCSLGRDENED